MRFEEAGCFREVCHMELERGVFSLGTIRDLGEFLCAPQGDLASRDLDHGPDGTALPHDLKSQEVPVEGEGFRHLVDRQDEVANILNDCHGTCIPENPYESAEPDGAFGPCESPSCGARTCLGRLESHCLRGQA